MRRALVGALALALGARAGRRVPDAAAHEPDRRRHGARDPARRGDRLPRRRPVAARHDGRRPGRRLRRRGRCAGVVARVTELKEDASLAAFYLISLALGVTIVSLKGSNVDLLHVLFGTRAGARRPDPAADRRHRDASRSSALAVIYRPLVLECVDPGFLRSVSRAGGPAHLAFLGARGAEPRRRLPCARHAARGRHDDAAGRRRALLERATSPR